MDPNIAPQCSPEEILLQNSTSLSALIRSWFWRFYDHLFVLIIINLFWFISCFAIAWAGWSLGITGSLEKLNPVGIYLLYLIECVVSIGWSYMVFKIFEEGGTGYQDYWVGLKRFFWKSFSISLIFGLVTELSLFGMRFYFLLNSHHRFIDFLLMSFLFWMILFWFSCSLYQWPILFFQNPPLGKIFYKSYLLVLGDGLTSLAIWGLFSLACLLFFVAPFLCVFVGFVFFFSLQSVALEKLLLRYKITYENKPLEPTLERLAREQQRGWSDFLRPWENR